MRKPQRPDRSRADLPTNLFRLCLLALLTGCGSADAPQVADPVALTDRDRESWDVRLQLHSTTSGSVTVEAPFVTDHSDVQQMRADSGVTVTLADSTGVTATFLSAHRLVVDHRNHTVALAGSVSAHAAARQVMMRADTMTWDRTADRLDLPAGADVNLSTGHLTARQLSGGSDLAQWTAQDVQSIFRDSSTEDEVGIDGRSAHVRSDDGTVMANFDSVHAHWRGREVGAAEAHYDGNLHRLFLNGSVVLQDSGRQVRADTVILDLSAHRITAHGSVRASGDFRFEADELLEDESGRWTVVGTDLWLEVDERRLEAGSMTLSADTDTITAAGGVRAVEEDRSIHADSLRLTRADHQLVAIGGVRVIAGDVEGTLQADSLRSTGEGGHVFLWGDAHLRRPREGEDLILAADTLRLDSAEDRLTGQGAFVLRSPPRVEMRADVGSYLTSGDTATLEGQVEFFYDAQESHIRLSADTCHVVLDSGDPVAIDWPGAMGGQLVDAEQTTWLQAQSGHGDLVDGRLTRLTLQGAVEVTHRGTGGRLSRFTATSMELDYGEDGVLQRVQAAGDALVRTRLPEEKEGGTSSRASFNEVSGARLEVDLDGGAVIAVRVLESIEGRFVPDDDRGGE